MMVGYMVMHVFCLIGCFGREVFNASSNMWGHFLRIIEILSVPLAYREILNGYSELAVITIRESIHINEEFLAANQGLDIN